MEIIWHQNPLKSVFRFSDEDKELLKLKVKLAKMEEAIGDAIFRLQDSGENSKYYDPKRALAHLSYTENENRLDEDFNRVLEELETGTHAGDCTCIPASCFKCYAESIIGVETIKGLSKHSGAKIQGRFSGEVETTIDEVLQALHDYQPRKPDAWKHMSDEHFATYVNAWKAQNEAAIQWLTDYKKQHFPDN